MGGTFCDERPPPGPDDDKALIFEDADSATDGLNRQARFLADALDGGNRPPRRVLAGPDAFP